MKKHHRLGDKGSQIHVMEWLPDDKVASSAIVFSHGFNVPGFESRRMFLDLAHSVVDTGRAAIVFDYRGSGYSDWTFDQMTMDSEISDLHSVLDWAAERFASRAVWGQSLGSGVAALGLESRDDIVAAVFWCLSSDIYERYNSRHGDELAARGEKYLPSGFKIKPSLLESMRDKDVYKSLRALTIPRLFIHGDADTVADISISERASSEALGDATLIRIAGGNHGFKSQPKLFDSASSQTVDWLRTRMKDTV